MNIAPAALPGPVELVTPGLDAARDFYAALLGWTYAGSAGLVQAYAGGAHAATLRSVEAPARWCVTFAVPDVAPVHAAATVAGARLDGDELCDPLGGSFRVRDDAQTVPPGPGLPCWYEYMTAAPTDADRFYAEALGLHATVPPGAPDDAYAVLLAGGRPVAGRLSLPTDLAAVLPSGWMVYFAVGDPDRVAGEAARADGRVVVAPRDVGTGRVAAIADPAGAVFTVIRPAGSA